MCRKNGSSEKKRWHHFTLFHQKKEMKGKMIHLNVWKVHDKKRFDPLSPSCSKEKREEIGFHSL